MIDEKAKKIIEENAMAFATVDGEYKPNVIGIACVKVVSENQILITDNYMKQTKENLKRNNNVSLVVWDKCWKGYKMIGTAEYFENGKWLEQVKKDPDNKGMPAKGAILVTLAKVMPTG